MWTQIQMLLPSDDDYELSARTIVREILTIANLRHTASRIWTCAELEFRLCWIKVYGSDNHYTTVPLKLWYLNTCKLTFWNVHPESSRQTPETVTTIKLFELPVKTLWTTALLEQEIISLQTQWKWSPPQVL